MIPSYYGNIVEDENTPKDSVFLFSPRYKWVPVEGGMREEIDWDATAKASAVIYNIGESKKSH